MRRIIVSHGPERRTLCLPLGDSARLGAAPDNDLVAPFAGVSRHHARLDSNPDGVLVVDLGSKNGLVSDGHRFENLLLTPQRRVLLGHAVLEVEEVADEDVKLGLRFGTPEAGATKASRRHAAAARPPGLGDGAPPTQETRELGDASAASPVPALRLMRRLGDGQAMADDDHRAALLAEAREAMQADWVAVFDLDEAGDMATDGWSGSQAADGELVTLEAALAAEPAGRAGVRRLELAQHFVLAAGTADERWLAAAFSLRRRPAAWVEELLACVAEPLLSRRSESGGAGDDRGAGPTVTRRRTCASPRAWWSATRRR